MNIHNPVSGNGFDWSGLRSHVLRVRALLYVFMNVRGYVQYMYADMYAYMYMYMYSMYLYAYTHTVRVRVHVHVYCTCTYMYAIRVQY